MQEGKIDVLPNDITTDLMWQLDAFVLTIMSQKVFEMRSS
jgi:hypothetical protein